MDFYADIIRIAKAELDLYEVGYADLSDDRRIVERWINVYLKLIKPTPRHVLHSAKVVAASHEPTLSPVLAAIEAKFRRGEDINPHLSKLIFRKDFTDYLFFDWGIYHLHLSMISERGYFMKRSDSLLFVIIHDPYVHFIDIRPHGEDLVFAQKELLQIVHDEWPHILSPFRMRAGGLPRRAHYDNPKEIEEMRKAGATVVHAFDNHVYLPPGGGGTSAGTSLKVGLEADMLYIAAKRTMGYIQQNDAAIRRRIASRVGLAPFVMDFHLELTEQGFLVTEQNSHYTFPLFPPQD